MNYQTEMQKSFVEEIEQVRKQTIRAYELLRKGENFKAKMQLILAIQSMSDLENIIEKDIKIEVTDDQSN